MSANLAARMRSQRRRWLELDDPPRRALLVERPTDLAAMERQFRSLVEIASQARTQVVDWRGVTEADLLGSGVGGSDPVPFSREVFDEWAGDHVNELAEVANCMLKQMQEHAEKAEEQGKN